MGMEDALTAVDRQLTVQLWVWRKVKNGAERGDLKKIREEMDRLLDERLTIERRRNLAERGLLDNEFVV